MAIRSKPTPGMDFDGTIHTDNPNDESNALALLNEVFEGSTFSDLAAAIDSGDVAHITDVDDINRIEKEKLIGKNMILVDWAEKLDNATGRMYVRCRAVVDNGTAAGEKVIFTDGSTGIMEQLRTYARKLGGVKPIHIPKGLVASTYPYTDEEGKVTMATTYYFNNES